VIKLYASTAGVWVPSLVDEFSSHLIYGMAQKKKKKREREVIDI